ncbi:hypothetical protein NFIA_103540 [Paecilomyces variotii No. 5]|uniref:Thioesterase-like superfamily-domain-containing protein n=1 Tax=Byssochlamys spectabilis (strain No. 5 / NBRC 109023) TaxID=1356009 RepID=V5I3R9_BYSSN|nr:hypothetical protein NFIA_103540 [Paecilomyces variotii No. 5]
MIAGRVVQRRFLEPAGQFVTSQRPVIQIRQLSTFPARQDAHTSSSSNSTKPHTIDPRWLTLTKRRLGKCMMFGLKPHQVDEAGKILQEIARDWRGLIAGSEGFLTEEKRTALLRHNVVWGEMDIPFSGCLWNQLTVLKGHVNNVTYVRYAESARVNFMRNFALHIDPDHRQEWMGSVNNTGIGLIIRSIKVDYKFPMTWPDKITVYQKLVRDPSSLPADHSAFELQVMILSEAKQRPAARVHEDNVTYDYRANRKTSLPPFMMEQFKQMWALQEEAKRTWQQRILDIEGRVRALELDSWDRADAVEDTGSAKGR